MSPIHRSLKSFRDFILAWVLIIGMGIIFVMGMYQALKFFPQVIKQQTGTVTVRDLPADVPLFDGAVFVDFKQQDTRSVYKYKLPLGATSTAMAFYASEMPKREWAKYVASEDMLGFYKGTGERQAFIKVYPTNGKVGITIEVIDKT